MGIVNCRYFNGYKPCGKNEVCSLSCSHKQEVSETILIIHLGALGSVVRSSALLRKIKKEKPDAFVVWLTSESVLPILENHQAIDRLYALNFVNLLKLQAMSFDQIFVIDKSLEAISIAQQLKGKQIKGFVANPVNGAVLPADSHAEEIWQLGIDNHRKFFINQKTELQLIFESLGLTYQGEKYWLDISAEEKKEMQARRNNWLSAGGKKVLIGINTGCSQVIAYKKLSLEKHQELITRIYEAFPMAQVVLLGGREDSQRNQSLKQLFLEVIASSTEGGLRDGILSVGACDIVVSGDSLGMHIAIALEKYTVAWFGPTCAQEIDIFGKGEKITTYLSCHPCWKRTCSKTQMCYDHVYIEEFIQAIRKGISQIELTSSDYQPEKNSSSAYSLSR